MRKLLRHLADAVVFAAALLTLCLASCSKTTYVPVETSKVETISDIRYRTDTVERYRDRVVERRGDTVYVTTTDVRYRSLRDSLYIYRCDSIEVPVLVEVPRLVAQPLTAWQRLQMRGFWVLLGCIALGAAAIWRRPLFRFLCKIVCL